MNLLPVVWAAIDTHRQAHRSPRILRAQALKRLIRTVRHAYRNVPFYSRSFDNAGVDLSDFREFDDLRRLPFLTKTDVQENFPGDLVARGTDLDTCIHSATTGSTGKATNFVFHPRTYAHYLACSLRELTMIGYRPWHKLVYIKYSKVPMPSMGPLFRVAHIPSMIPVQEHIARLREEKPDMLVGYASLIHDIARNVSDDDLRDIQPKFISLNSDMSTRDQREYITRRLGCPVYDEYSTEETWMIAAQCPEHNYHLFTDNVWVEFLNPNGNVAEPDELREIVVTTLRAPTMPFIRYRIGDLGRPSQRTCACGRGFPLMESFEGRADDAFVLSHGGHVPSLKLLNTFTTFIKSDAGLMDEFKLIQTHMGRATVLLCPGPAYRPERAQALLDKLQAIIPEPVAFDLQLVRRVTEPGSIKRKAIESRVRRDRCANSAQ
jgi:phenylacetate-CoA ligase